MGGHKTADDDDYIIMSIDSSGAKITNRGQWMDKKWNVQNRKRLSQNPHSSEYKDQRNHCVRGNG